MCSFLNYWEKKYKHMWEIDKEGYIRRYEKAQKALASFEADVQRYINLEEEVLGEDSTTNMRFLRIDCGPLKQMLVGHCEQWVQKFTGLLNQLAAQELSALHDHFQQNAAALAVVPLNMDQLAEVVNLHRRLADEKKKTEMRFEPLRYACAISQWPHTNIVRMLTHVSRGLCSG